MTDPVPIFLPYRSEFGHMVMHHAPMVKHCHDPRKRVICEPGYEALYPCELPHIHCDIKADQHRREWASYDVAYLRFLEQSLREASDIPDNAEFVPPLPKHPENTDGLEFFVPKPHSPVDDVGGAPIVICPRTRKYGRDKNWEHWATVYNLLVDEHDFSVFAVGNTRYPGIEPYQSSWSYECPLDATIEAMNRCQLVVSTDNGLAHLAMLCGKPLLLITCDDDGMHRVAPNNQEVKLRRFEANNHKKVPIKMVGAWHDPKLAVDAATANIMVHPGV